jgi:hypothetical protein
MTVIGVSDHCRQRDRFSSVCAPLGSGRDGRAGGFGSSNRPLAAASAVKNLREVCHWA